MLLYFLMFHLSEFKSCNYVFRTCTYTELCSPYSHAGAYVIPRILQSVWAIGIFVYRFGYPRKRPHLPVVRMSAKLKVNACILCFFKLIRLVIKQYDIPVFVHTLHKRLHAFSSSVASVVAPYDTYAFIEINHAVSQKHNSGVREKLLRMPHTAIIFVIAGTGINRSIQLTKLRCHVFFNQWPYAAVYNIAGY